jgi:VIT1/CCC1 family predicted Fe2+/Mn2+ transporter
VWLLLAPDFRRYENHFAHRAGSLRAKVIGANNGVCATIRLIVDVMAKASSQTVPLAGVSGQAPKAMATTTGGGLVS